MDFGFGGDVVVIFYRILSKILTVQMVIMRDQ